MKIAVIGTGYVGLVAGACFADTGNDVICVDKDARKVEALRAGEIPIYEPGLDTVVRRGAAQKRLQFTTDTAMAVRAAEVIFLAVGTPSQANGEPDMRYVKAAAEEIGQAMTQNKTGYRIIVNKSTVPVGSHATVREWVASKTVEPFDVASNPEFLKEGAAVDDFMKPDRVVIGTEKESVYQKMAELYAPFVRQGNPVLWMDPLSAEITKYACNSFLATRISFMNEIAGLCERVGADVEMIRKGMATDPRIGKHFLYAGVGYGGSCFPKDIDAMLTTGRKFEAPLSIVAAARQANDRQKKHLLERVRGHFGGTLSGKSFAFWGLAFKPNTDDVREAPALVMIEALLREGARVRAFDPVATETSRQALAATSVAAQVATQVHFCASPYEALEGADALLVVTEWNEFRQPDFAKMKALLRPTKSAASGKTAPAVFDGRNVFDPARMKELGFHYYGIGRRVV